MSRVITLTLFFLAGVLAIIAVTAIQDAAGLRLTLQARDAVIADQAREIHNLRGTVRDNLRTIEQLLGGRQPEHPSRGRTVERRLARVTAYTAGAESTGKAPGHPEYGVTASTHRINVGAGEKLAAAGLSIPFGARVYVPGLGWAPIRDRGAAIGDGDIDIYFDDVETAREWGVKHMQVLIVK